MKIKRNILEHRGGKITASFPPSQTSQQEPSLHEILVRYQNGLDISNFVTTQASKATADMQFSNRVGKTDFLTEIPQHIKKVAVAERKKEVPQNQSPEQKEVPQNQPPEQKEVPQK